MGGKTISTEQQKIANIALQTSSYGLTLPKIYGTQRVSGNLIWYGNFTAVPHTTTTSSGGKGVGKVTQKDTTYTYTAAVMMALAEGPITGVGAVWKGKDKVTLSSLGLTLFSGTPTQATWSFLTGYNIPANWNYESLYGYYDWYTHTVPAFTDQALNYSSTAYLAASAYDLGTDASVPNHGFEVLGSLIYSGQSDANPGDIVPDMLTAQQYGANFPGSMIGSTTLYTQYCVANGLFVSPAYTEQKPTADCLKELTDLTNSAVVWSGGLLKIIPYGDVAVTGNGQTYTPNLTPLYDLGDDDFLKTENGDPVRVRRSTPADAKNRITLEFSNRVNQYNTEVVAVEDQDAIEKYGLKPAENISAHMFCTPTAAKMAAQLQLQRLLYKRNTYYFGLNARYAMLEPMDIVTLTDAGLGMNRVAVRIIEITEIDDGYDVVAEDLNIGVANAPSYAHDSGLRWQMTVNATPSSVNAPYIFELPADPTTTGLALGIAVGGGTSDPLYGGCRIWTSLDGTNYKAVGVIYGSSRYGTLTAAYAAATGVDSVNTMKVSLVSGGQLISGSATDAANAATLCIVDNEFLAHQTAALTGVNAYDLKPVNRALYSTTGAAHASGAKWARIDQAIQRLTDLDLSLIGKTIYVKCTAFNTYGAGEQQLSAATAYTYTITGWAKALETPDPLAVQALLDAQNFRQTSVPVGAVEGNYWTDIDDFNITYRHSGLGLYINGVVLTINSNQMDIPWVSIQDKNVTDALAAIAGQASRVSSAELSLTAIQSDGVLSRGEKTEVIRQVTSINNEYSGIVLKSQALGITTELTAYTNAFNALTTYINSVSGWNDASVDTTINGATFRSNFVAYYDARTTLLAKNDEVAATKANWSGVTGTVGQPTGGDVAGTVNPGGGVAPNQVNTAAVQANAITAPVVVAGSTSYSATNAWGGILKAPGVEVNMGTAISGYYEVECFIDIQRDTLAWLAGDQDIWAEVKFQMINFSGGGSFGSGTTPGSQGIAGQNSKYSDFKYFFVNSQTTVLHNIIRLRHTERIFRSDVIGQTIGFELLFTIFATGARAGQSSNYKSGTLSVREFKK